MLSCALVCVPAWQVGGGRGCESVQRLTPGCSSLIAHIPAADATLMPDCGLSGQHFRLSHVFPESLAAVPSGVSSAEEQSFFCGTNTKSKRCPRVLTLRIDVWKK